MLNYQNMHEYNALASSKAIIKGDQWRITVITEALIRLEWSDSGEFTDERTQTVVCRNFNKPVKYNVIWRDGWLELDTESVHLSYNGGPFSPEGLFATVKNVNSNGNTWRYDSYSGANLGGTIRTLDNINGATKLENGILSQDGWSVLDDSHSNILAYAPIVDGKLNPFETWPVARVKGSIDIYFFAYGHRYKEAIHDFYQLTGPTPLLPKFALGNWWSRYHRYDEHEYESLIDRFEKENIPFSVAVLDMDWHLVDSVESKFGSGWTGFTWNRDLFPNPSRFLLWLHTHGLRVSLNLHPRDGIRAYEQAYSAMTKAMNLDPSSQETVQFDPTSPTFMKSYFDVLLAPMEREGVDFWWMDWQQGSYSKKPGLDPLWMLNDLHFKHSKEHQKRPIIFSRYAGPGSHRYPIGFSGDTIVTWESLRFQPYFTATASNIGYGWWSHDIGGHMSGYRDEELEARWYQLGTFSPINRLHSTSFPYNGKEPWNFKTEIKSSMIKSLQLRHRLIPYLYSMNVRAAYEGEPLIQPMYWEYPDESNSYISPTQYWFGSEILVAPITSPNEKSTQSAKTTVWFPKGLWYDFFTGRRYDSSSEHGRWINVWRGIDQIPVFAKAGAIVPLQQEKDLKISDQNLDRLDILIFLGCSSTFILWEDDGKARDWKDWSRTTLEMVWTNQQNAREFIIHKACGSTSNIPASRSWNVILRGVRCNQDDVSVMSGDALISFVFAYDEETLSASIRVDSIPSNQDLRFVFSKNVSIADQPISEDCFSLLLAAQIPDSSKGRIHAALQCKTIEEKICALDALKSDAPEGVLKDNAENMPRPLMEALHEVLCRSNSN